MWSQPFVIHCYQRQWNSLGPINQKKYWQIDLLLNKQTNRQREQKQQTANPFTIPESHSFYKLLGKLSQNRSIFICIQGNSLGSSLSSQNIPWLTWKSIPNRTRPYSKETFLLWQLQNWKQSHWQNHGWNHRVLGLVSPPGPKNNSQECRAKEPIIDC